MNTNPKVTSIPINALGAGFTPIVMTIMASKVRVMEDPSYNNGAPQGLTGYYADTQPATGNPQTGTLQVWLPNNQGQIGPAYQPISFGGGEGGRVEGGQGDYVGADGTVILYLTTNTQLASAVLLEEWA